MNIVVFLVVLGVLVFVHELGHFIAARRCGVRVEVFSLGFGPKLIGVKRGDTEYKISAIPLGGYVKMAGENPSDKPTGAEWEFLSRPVGDRFKIVISGVLLNYILGFIIFSSVFMIGIPIAKNTNRIGSLISGYPAAKSGIESGDSIIAVNEIETETWEELVKIIYGGTENQITVKIERDREIFDITMKPRFEKRFIISGGRKIGLIGIRPEYDIKRYNILKSLWLGARQVADITYRTFEAIGLMITGKISVREMTGPVGIFIMTGEMATLGFVYLLNFIGLISTSLAIINILPVPVLDGGHLVFLLIEKIRGRSLSFKTQETAAQVGLFLLITLMIFIFYSDFIKFGVIEKVLTLFK